MFQRILSVAVLATMVVGALAAGGCDAGGGGSPVGTWTFSKDRSKAVFSAWAKGEKSLDTEEKRQSEIQGHGLMIDMISGAGEARITLNADKTCRTLEPRGSIGTGTWTFDAATGELKVKSGEGNEQTAKLVSGELVVYEKTAPIIVFVKGGEPVGKPAEAPAKAPAGN
ncbi:MAG: hypothetical protein JNJ48_04480 [Phycisphaerae bacterium]|nr:hypothetical protein [Phycisphaerae bacterium]